MNRPSEKRNIIEGLLAIAQGLLLVGLSAIAIFVVYIPLSLAMITIFGMIGSACFLCGIEALKQVSGIRSQGSGRDSEF